MLLKASITGAAKRRVRFCGVGDGLVVTGRGVRGGGSQVNGLVVEACDLLHGGRDFYVHLLRTTTAVSGK